MGTMTDLAAPGEGMVAPTGDSGYSSVEGTSFATPLVTGAVVLLQQIYQARFGTLPTVNQVTQWLEKGSDPIYDPVTGLTIGRLDIPKAAALIPTATSSPAPAAASAPVTVSIHAVPSDLDDYKPGDRDSDFLCSGSARDRRRPARRRRHTGTPPVSTATTSTSLATTTASSPPTSPAVVPQAPPASPSSGLSPDVQVFVNGEQVNSLNASQSSMLPSIAQDNYASLLKAMSAWAAGTGSDQAPSASVSQVQHLERGIVGGATFRRREWSDPRPAAH